MTDKTLRDEFAIAALKGLCSQCDAAGMWSWRPKDAAEMAYQIADEMLKARSNKG